MNNEELQKHREALDFAADSFDSEKSLMSFHTKQNTYHTGLADRDVHPVRESLSYAVALLYGERKTDFLVAEQIIETVLDLQDKNPESDTFGIWPYYEEEPIEKMDAPDRNWADFLGKLLLEILFFHREKLKPDLVPKMENACRYACESIIRRDESVQYTNIAFTDTLVTIAAGELLGEKRLIRYGKDKMERFLAFERNNGGLFEFNSPCYTPLVARDAATFLKLVKDEEARDYAEKINYITWKMIAEHFRADMLQLAGPQSRAYSDYLSDSLMYDIELACDGEVEFDCDKKINIETFWTKASCPKDLRGYFKGEIKPKSTEKLIMTGFNYPFFAFSQVAATYHAENYTVGTYNREELWNQRRPLIAYIKGGKKPYCFRVRCLHDGYDFSSAELHCVQEGPAILAAVNFAADRGDTHIGLDNTKDAEYNELSVTFELEGDMREVSVEEKASMLILWLGEEKVEINIAAARFGINRIVYNINKGEDKLVYSVILYSGPKAKIDLKEIDAAYVCFTIDFGDDKRAVSCVENGDFIEAKRDAGGKTLKIKTYKKAMPFMNMMYEDWQWKDSKLLESIAKQKI